MMIVKGLLLTNPEIFLANIILGAFLIFAGTSIIWAIKDLQVRVSVLVWNALVRASAVFVVTYATILGAIPIEIKYYYKKATKSKDFIA